MAVLAHRRARDDPTRLPREPAAAVSLLYERLGSRVFRFCWHMLGERYAAEDATQSTFLAAHAALAGGAEVLYPRAWLLTIARHECGRLLAARETRGGEELDAAVVAPDDVEADVERRTELSAAAERLAALPVAQREAFVLREWLGLSTSEVAVALGTTLSAVHALIHRAREQLLVSVSSGDAAGCRHTRARLAEGVVDRAARAHLVRCRECREARRALGDVRETSLAALFPVGLVASRLAASINGFDAATAGAAGGGTLTLLASPSLTAKLAALLAVGATAGGAGAIATRPAAPHRVATHRTEHTAQPSPPEPRPHVTRVRGGIARTAVDWHPAPRRAPVHTVAARARGGAATATVRPPARGDDGNDRARSGDRSGDDGGSSSSRQHESGRGDAPSPGDADDGRGTAAAGHTGVDGARPGSSHADEDDGGSRSSGDGGEDGGG
jgi:RNA polymerase sigma-70 factor (ECF subfamily)